MGRLKQKQTKAQIAARVSPLVKIAIEAVAKEERRTESQTIEILLEESPRIRAKLSPSNGNRKQSITV